MKELKIMGLFLFLVAIVMLILTFYNRIEDEEALVVLASYFICLFLSACVMALGLAMIFYKKKEDKSE